MSEPTCIENHAVSKLSSVDLNNHQYKRCRRFRRDRESRSTTRRSLKRLRKHPSVTDLVEPDLVSYFALPGGILTSLAPGGFLKTPW